MPWKEIIIALISASATLGAVWLTYFLNARAAKNKNNQDEMSNRIKRDFVVYKILNDIKKKFIFSRVIVIQFHNGSKYYTGEAIQKASVAFETLSPGVAPLSKNMQNIPLSTMTTSLRPISEDGIFKVDDIEELEEGHYKFLMEAYNEVGHFSFKIEDDTGWIGVLVCSYTKDNPRQHLTDACLEFLRVQAARVGGILRLTNKSYTIRQI